MSVGQSIVFVQTREEADRVARTLTESGYECSILHGALEPALRDRTMEACRNGESNVLITTNVLARGVDVDNVGLVVNYEIPLDVNRKPDTETYLHRIGRTGRFGRLLVTALDNTTVLQKSVFDEILLLNELVHGITFEHQGYNYR